MPCIVIERGLPPEEGAINIKVNFFDAAVRHVATIRQAVSRCVPKRYGRSHRGYIKENAN
jgi:hypothetical protein